MNKELQELMDGLHAVAICGAGVFEDKKISIGDIGHLFALAKKYDVLKSAVEGLDEVKLKEMDGDSMEIIIEGIIAIIGEFKKN